MVNGSHVVFFLVSSVVRTMPYLKSPLPTSTSHIKGVLVCLSTLSAPWLATISLPSSLDSSQSVKVGNGCSTGPPSSLGQLLSSCSSSLRRPTTIASSRVLSLYPAHSTLKMTTITTRKTTRSPPSRPSQAKNSACQRIPNPLSTSSPSGTPLKTAQCLAISAASLSTSPGL